MVSFTNYLAAISLLIGSCLSLSQRSASRSKSKSSGYFTKEIQLPPLPSNNAKYGDSIPVCYTNSPRSLSLWLEDHIPTGGATVGFDVESVPNAPWLRVKFQGPATVQIAVADAAVVVQLVDRNGNPSDASASVLQAMLADETIIAAGVGLDQDMIELHREWGSGDSEIKGRFDMGGIGGSAGRTAALKTLTQTVVQVELQKSRKLAVSNWGQVPLKEEQIAYCARDAWAAAAIMAELAERDPDTYSQAALIKRLEKEVSIAELDTRARGRKVAKTRLLKILGKGDERVKVEDLSDDLRHEVDKLEVTMRNLAPPRPFIFDVHPLGMTL